MLNDFYFTSKVPFVLKILKFLYWHFGHLAKRLNKKEKVNFKFYDVTAWYTHILNISRSKGNLTMKCGQVIEFNMRNIFLEKSYVKSGGETSSLPFAEKLKLSISLDQ